MPSAHLSPSGQQTGSGYTRKGVFLGARFNNADSLYRLVWPTGVRKNLVQSYYLRYSHNFPRTVTPKQRDCNMWLVYLIVSRLAAWLRRELKAGSCTSICSITSVSRIEVMPPLCCTCYLFNFVNSRCFTANLWIVLSCEPRCWTVNPCWFAEWQKLLRYGWVSRACWIYTEQS